MAPTPRTSPVRHRALIAVSAVAVLALGACSGSDDGDETEGAAASTSTTEPASQFGSSMGVSRVDVAEVQALGDGPGPGEQWSIPMGVSICGRFIDVPAGEPVGEVVGDAGAATVTGSEDGAAPTVGDYAASVGIELEAGRLTLPSGVIPPELDNTEPPTPVAGATFRTGDTCNDTTAEVQVWVYSEEAARTGDGIMVVTQNPAAIPFAQDGMAMVIALSPESSLPTLPPSAMAG
ncbi:MAG: hypothetical protein ACK4V6_17445 [Microthrixaceae bacterium]